MPVTSLPIYGLRNRAGPGGFCRHMAYLHRGSAARAPAGSRLPACSPQGSGAGGPSRSPGPGLRACQGGAAPKVRLRLLWESDRVPAAARPPGRGGIPVLRTFQKRRRSGAGSSASPALVWEPFRKIKLRKETERSRDTTVKPLLTFLAAQNRKQKEAERKKKKKKLHAFTEADCFFLNYLVERSGW